MTATTIQQDLDKDYDVDFFDFFVFIEDWQLKDPSPADFNDSGKVDYDDFFIFADLFGWSGDPFTSTQKDGDDGSQTGSHSADPTYTPSAPVVEYTPPVVIVDDPINQPDFVPQPPPNDDTGPIPIIPVDPTIPSPVDSPTAVPEPNLVLLAGILLFAALKFFRRGM